MKYSGSSIVSTRQVGEARVVIENDLPVAVTIISSESIKRGTEDVVTVYYTSQFPGRRFTAAELYADGAAAKAAFSALDVV